MLANKLRTDGIYVQLGFREWYTPGGEDTSCHWYNIFRVLNDQQIAVMGTNIHPFYDQKDRKDLNHRLYSFIDEPENILQTVQQILAIPIQEIKENEGKGYSLYYTRIMDMEEGELRNGTYVMTHAVSPWENDDFYIYHEGNPHIIKDWRSPNRVECDLDWGWWCEDKEHPHDFPFYFIPSDFSMKEIWEEKVKEWMGKRNSKDNNDILTDS